MAKSDEKKAGLYEKWLRHFALNIMTQSFHAFFLLFVMKMLSAISTEQTRNMADLTSNDGILAIMSIVGMMAIIKFEKLFKELFGMNDSIAGNLKASGAQMFAGIKSAGQFGKEVKAPFTNYANSKRNMVNKAKAAGVPEGKIGKYINMSGGTTVGGMSDGGISPGGTSVVNKSSNPPLSDRAQELFEKAKEAKKNGDMDSYRDYRDNAATQMRQDRAFADAKASGALGGGASRRANVANTNNANSANAAGVDNSGGVNSLSQKQQEYNDSVLEHRKNMRKVPIQSAVNLAALAMGMGGTDNMAEAVTAANLINNPMNFVANTHIDHGENITARESTSDRERYNYNTVSEAISKGFERATAGSKNDNGNINPVKLTVQAAKEYVSYPIKTVKNAVTTSKVDNVDDL